MERRLAAILIADVVGYSHLSQLDEEGTRARFRVTLQEVIQPKIALHQGRLVKTMGDGLLIEFASVVNALRCAVDVQRALFKRNAGLPIGQKLEFRIGINLGDVIVEGDDIHGNGVNIAARLQGLAKPGGVAISGTVYDQITNKLNLDCEYLGEQRVKNIAEPVRVYAVLPNSTRPVAAMSKGTGRPRRWQTGVIAAAAAGMIAAAAVVWLHPWTSSTKPPVAEAPSVAQTRPALVVLPFDNLSDDKQQGYLADGITGDLTTALAQVPGMFVISRNAAFGYKGKNIQPARLAAELGIGYILEGSVRRTGADMRINAQLVDAKNGGNVWARLFDGPWSDIFALQNRVVEVVVSALKLRLVEGRRVYQAAGGTSNPTAYDAYLRGLELVDRGASEDQSTAAMELEQAVALDPNFGRAYAELAWLYWDALGSKEREHALGLSADEVIAKANSYLEEAGRHPSPTYYQVLADRFIWRQNTDDAISAVQRAIALDPSDPDSYEEMSLALTLNGRPQDGRSFIDTALLVDPGWTPYRRFLAGLAYFTLGRFEDAAASLEKIDLRSSDFWAEYYGLILLTATYGQLGNLSKAKTVNKELHPYAVESGDREMTGLVAMNGFPFKNYADMERLLEGLRRSGVPQLSFGFDPAAKDRLSGERIRSLLFGHEVRGRELGSGDSYVQSTSADGAASTTIGRWSDHGSSRIEGDFVCTWYMTRLRRCAALFLNAHGTRKDMNEYLSVGQSNRFEFSVVK